MVGTGDVGRVLAASAIFKSLKISHGLGTSRRGKKYVAGCNTQRVTGFRGESGYRAGESNGKITTDRVTNPSARQ